MTGLWRLQVHAAACWRWYDGGIVGQAASFLLYLAPPSATLVRAQRSRGWAYTRGWAYMAYMGNEAPFSICPSHTHDTLSSSSHDWICPKDPSLKCKGSIGEFPAPLGKPSQLTAQVYRPRL